MAIETGSGSKAERSPANTSKSSSSSSKSTASATKSTGSRDSVASKAAGQAAASKVTSSTFKPASSSTPKAHQGSSDSGSSSRSSPAKAPSSAPAAHQGSSESNSGSRDSVAARSAGERSVAQGRAAAGSIAAANAMASNQSGLAAALAATLNRAAPAEKRSREDDYSSTALPQLQSDDMRLMRQPMVTQPTYGAPVPDMQSIDMRLMRQPMVTPPAYSDAPVPTTQSTDMRLMRQPMVTPPQHVINPPRYGDIDPANALMMGQYRLDANDGVVFEPYEQLFEEAEALTAPSPRPSRERPVDPRIVQTLLGEAGNQGALGIAGVAQTVMNRSQKDPDNIIDPLDVVMAPWQYSTWNDPANGGNNPQRFQPGTPAYQEAEGIWRDVRDNAFDFTGGATHYWNPDHADPNWAKPGVAGTERKYDVIGIGDHNFLPTVPVQARGFLNSNPALASTIAAGGIGPDAPVPQMRPANLGGGIDIATGPGYTIGISDRVRMAQSPTNQQDRLMPDVGTAGGIGIAPTAFTDLRAIDANGNYIGSGPPMRVASADPITGGSMGGPTGPIPSSYVEETMPPMPRPRPERESVWDKTVSAAGDALDNTLIGGAVKALFPEFWEGSGEAIKNLGRGGLSLGDYEARAHEGSSDSDSGGSYYAPPPPAAPGQVPVDPVTGQPLPPNLAALWNIWYPKVQWPGAGYDPGVSGEWDYFPEFAEGGPVLAPQRMAQMPATADLDPRLITIMNAEDALRGQHPEPDAAIQAFLEEFGEAALRKLYERVQGAMASPDPQDGPRMIDGPGGPKDDMVPAIIDGTQPAKLSAGEFVMPAEAVAGAGDGDPVAGAEKLTQLADMLGRGA